MGGGEKRQSEQGSRTPNEFWKFAFIAFNVCCEWERGPGTSDGMRLIWRSLLSFAGRGLGKRGWTQIEIGKIGRMELVMLCHGIMGMLCYRNYTIKGS